MKHIYCSGCFKLVAKIVDKSQIRKQAVMLCGKCETKRKASDLAALNKPKDAFSDMFGSFMKR